MSLIRSSSFIVIGLFALSVTRAADLTWTGTTGFLFFDNSAFWDPSQSPTGSDDLLFDIDLAGNAIIVGATSQFSDMRFSDFDWEFTGGAGGTLTSTTGSVRIDDPLATSLTGGTNVAMTDGVFLDMAGDFYVGQEGFGGLSIESDADMRSRDVFIGQNAGSVGQVTVIGTGSTLITEGTDSGNGYFIGQAGTGTLNVADGALARIRDDTSGGIADLELGVAATGNGTLNIDGPGSQFIAEDSFFGRSGTATVNVTGGGRLLQNVHDTADAVVAEAVGSVGNVVVSGDGSQWQARRIEIGNAGDATLSVESGGFVRSNSGDNMVLGDLAESSGRVAIFGAEAGNASRVEVAEDLFVGDAGRGELLVGQDLAGNTVGSGELQVGGNLRIGSVIGNREDNRMVITGAGSTASVGNQLRVAEDGDASLEVFNGATVTATNFLTIGGGLTESTGVATVDGVGTSLTTAKLFMGNTNTTATLNVTGGGRVSLTGTGLGVANIGDDTTGVGTVNVTGPGSRLEATNGAANFWIGGSSTEDGGTGTLNLADGAEVLSAGDLIVGYQGASDNIANGTINVTAGGVFKAQGEVDFGLEPDTISTLTVDGRGSFFDANDSDDGIADGRQITTLGGGGGADVDITDGGRLDAENLYLGNQDAGTNGTIDVRVSGVNTDGVPLPSMINVTGNLLVGVDRVASLTIEEGGVVNSATDGGNINAYIGGTNTADPSSVTVTGAGSAWTHGGTGDLSVGRGSDQTTARASLLIRDGGRVEGPDVILADFDNSASFVEVVGAGSRLDARLRLLVGDQGDATLQAFQGGVVTADLVEVGAFQGGNGLVEISDSGSRIDVERFISVGDDGDARGRVNVTDGAVLVTGTNGFIGVSSASGSNVVVGAAAADDDGHATATFVVGDSTEGGSLYLGGNANGNTFISSTSRVTGQLRVNPTGVVDVNGELRVWDRGEVVLDGGVLEVDSINLTPTSSTIPNDPTFRFNTGTLRIDSNAIITPALAEDLLGTDPTLAAGQTLAITGAASVTTPLRINGGELSIGSLSITEFQDNIDFDAGTLSLTNAGLVVTAAGLLGNVAVIDADETINVTTNVLVQGDGLLSVAGGTLTMGGGVVNSGGTLVVAGGNANFGTGLNNSGDTVLIDTTTTGTLANNADLTLVNTVLGGSFVNNASGTLSLGVGTTGTADVLDLTGVASLGGTLDVSLDDPMGFTLGDEIDLLLADAGVTGTFDNALLPALGGGLAFDLLYEANRVALLVVAGLPGDYNGNGIVDAADYTVWRDGDSPDSSPAGYDIWASNYGATVADIASATVTNAVPEPSAGLLLLAAFSAVSTACRLR